MTAIVLAGGKSSRFGENKALVEVAGRPLIERVISALKRSFNEIIIVADDITLFQHLGAKVVSDIIPGQGPLSGIHAGLRNTSNFYNFVVACDMPLLQTELIEYMKKKVNGSDILWPRRDDKIEPLHAFYSRNCLEVIERHLKAGELKITDLAKEIKVAFLESEEIYKLDPGGYSFANINTRADLERILSRAKEGVA